MGIIGCELDNNYRQNETLEELRMRDEENSLKKLYIKYNSKIPDKISDLELRNLYKTNRNAKYIKNIKNDKKLHEKMNLSKKLFNSKKNNEYNKNKIELNENNDDLIIITPRNNILLESCNNEITDDYTIKNETAVYNIENFKGNYKIISNLKEIKEDKNSVKDEKNENIYNNKNKSQIINKENSKISNNKLSNSKSFISRKKVISKKLNLNNLISNKKEKNYSSNRTNTNNNSKMTEQKLKNIIKSNDKSDKISKRKIIQDNINKKNLTNKSKNSVNNRTHNIPNLQNFYFNPLYDRSQYSNEKRYKSNQTVENQNIQLSNIILHQLPLFQKEEILPNIERKTYQEDLEIETPNYEKGKLSSEPRKKNISSREYFIINDNGQINDNSKIVEKLNNIYQVLYNKNNNFIKKNEKKSYKKSISPDNIYYNYPILKKHTAIDLRTNSFKLKNNNFKYMNNNDSNSISLFNNSTNLSINFINKVSKSEKNRKKVSSYVDKQNNINFQFNRNNNNIGNPFLNYNIFYNKNMTKNNIKKNNSKKEKSHINNSKSYNNIFNIKNKNKKISNKSCILNNNMKLLSQPFRDIIEINLSKKRGKSLIDNEIMNNIIGNKYIFSYKIIDNIDTKKILYDGVIYKVIDNIEKKDDANNINNNYKYELLDRYFQICKNCFKYYNNINEAINEKDKPLVQFDIRYIKAIEIIENNFLKNYKINGKKNIGIIFCIHIEQNNDFFVFAHNNIHIGSNIINILLFLKRYYEDT